MEMFSDRPTDCKQSGQFSVEDWRSSGVARMSRTRIEVSSKV